MDEIAPQLIAATLQSPTFGVYLITFTALVIAGMAIWLVGKK